MSMSFSVTLLIPWVLVMAEKIALVSMSIGFVALSGMFLLHVIWWHRP